MATGRPASSPCIEPRGRLPADVHRLRRPPLRRHLRRDHPVYRRGRSGGAVHRRRAALEARDVCARPYGGVWLALTCAGIRYRVAGREALPESAGRVLLEPREQRRPAGAVPGPASASCTSSTRPSCTAFPIMGTVFDVGGFVPVDRGDRDKAMAVIHARRRVAACGQLVPHLPGGDAQPHRRAAAVQEGRLHHGHRGAGADRAGRHQRRPGGDAEGQPDRASGARQRPGRHADPDGGADPGRSRRASSGGCESRCRNCWMTARYGPDRHPRPHARVFLRRGHQPVRDGGHPRPRVPLRLGGAASAVPGFQQRRRDRRGDRHVPGRVLRRQDPVRRLALGHHSHRHPAPGRRADRRDDAWRGLAGGERPGRPARRHHRGRQPPDEDEHSRGGQHQPGAVLQLDAEPRRGSLRRRPRLPRASAIRRSPLSWSSSCSR